MTSVDTFAPVLTPAEMELIEQIEATMLCSGCGVVGVLSLSPSCGHQYCAKCAKPECPGCGAEARLWDPKRKVNMAAFDGRLGAAVRHFLQFTGANVQREQEQSTKSKINKSPDKEVGIQLGDSDSYRSSDEGGCALDSYTAPNFGVVPDTCDLCTLGGENDSWSRADSAGGAEPRRAGSISPLTPKLLPMSGTEEEIVQSTRVLASEVLELRRRCRSGG